MKIKLILLAMLALSSSIKGSDCVQTCKKYGTKTDSCQNLSNADCLCLHRCHNVTNLNPHSYPSSNNGRGLCVCQINPEALSFCMNNVCSLNNADKCSNMCNQMIYDQQYIR